MITIDNALPDLAFQRIKEIISSTAFPWFYVGTAYEERASGLNDYSWFHMAKDRDWENSFLCNELEKLIVDALNRADISVNQMIRIRLGLITVTSVPIIHAPHVDLIQPHSTGLLYIDNSDGDTLIYNEKYDPENGLDVFNYYKIFLKDELTIKDKITPEQNKIVCFDGYRYHSSTSPTMHPRRIVINFNYN
jgi:hypothetical protein